MPVHPVPAGHGPTLAADIRCFANATLLLRVAPGSQPNQGPPRISSLRCRLLYGLDLPASDIETSSRSDWKGDVVVPNLTWNAFRGRLNLEYKILAQEPDLGRRNILSPFGDGTRQENHQFP